MHSRPQKLELLVEVSYVVDSHICNEFNEADCSNIIKKEAAGLQSNNIPWVLTIFTAAPPYFAIS